MSSSPRILWVHDDVPEPTYDLGCIMDDEAEPSGTSLAPAYHPVDTPTLSEAVAP